MEILTESIKQSPSPLYMKLCFDQAVKWTSCQDQEECTLEEGVGAAISKFFSNLEEKHGELLVSHILGLLTASKYGLSDSEFDVILSLDEEVLDEVFLNWTPAVRNAPTVLWARIRNELGSYVVRQERDGILLNRWCDRHFVEAAKERYLADDENKEKFHKMLAQFFIGTQEEKPEEKQEEHEQQEVEDEGAEEEDGEVNNGGEQELNPNSNPGVQQQSQNNVNGGGQSPNDEPVNGGSAQADQNNANGEVKEEKRSPTQPTRFTNACSGVVYNRRKLSELPTHLIVGTDNISELKQHVLCNFAFISAKLEAYGYQAIVDDFKAAMLHFPDDSDIKSIYEILVQSEDVLTQFADQMACQFVGRLCGSEDQLSSGLSDLLDSIRGCKLPYFIPTRRCFDEIEIQESAGGQELVGHSESINDVTITQDGSKAYSSSADKTLR